MALSEKVTRTRGRAAHRASDALNNVLRLQGLQTSGRSLAATALDTATTPDSRQLIKKRFVACGSAPCGTEAGRSFLQKRLSLFGKFAFALCATNYLAISLLISVESGTSWLESATRLPIIGLHLIGCGAFFGIFFACRNGIRSYLQLTLADALGAFFIGAVLGMSWWQGIYQGAGAHLAALAITIALLARALIVPSSATNSFLTGVLATSPVIFGVFSTVGPTVSSTLHGISGTAAIIIATVTSRVIYGLRCEMNVAKQFGQYTLEERIGGGGMGEVYRASHAMLRRPTAVKLLRSKMTQENIARFEREVQFTSQLTHPNTIDVYDYGLTPEGVFYYAMEYLPGLNLDDLVSGYGPLPPARVIHILKQICSSLSEAHSLGLIHRDIKPANIILCERGGIQDVVKVLDFGLIKDMDARRAATTSPRKRVTGTPMYLSPEGIRSPDQVDARSDLYSVGAVGYFLLTGKHLFDRGSVVEICSHHMNTPPVSPSIRLGKSVPKDLERVILKCLEKDADHRFDNTKALNAALERCSDFDKWNEEAAAMWWERRGVLAVRSSETTSVSEPKTLTSAIAKTKLISA